MWSQTFGPHCRAESKIEYINFRKNSIIFSLNNKIALASCEWAQKSCPDPGSDPVLWYWAVDLHPRAVPERYGTENPDQNCSKDLQDIIISSTFI